MPLLTCKLCGKVFTSAGGRTCPACLDRLDALYPTLREFLRDNPKVGFNVESLSDTLGIDIRDVQALVDMGYLDRDLGKSVQNLDLDRQKLAKEFEDSLKQMKEATARHGAQHTASYGQQRYGEKKKP
ncbi:MAG: hypothetical protein LBQ90_00945 [Synergistaceae bacterium]|jgi:energy-coupling factor transporter ATP-binding protein EcfA2|nr:hypothetical protein [Synergistaceae bacterium]